MGRAAVACLLALGGASGASAQYLHSLDAAPGARNSALLVTPEALKLDAFTGSAGYAYAIAVPPGTGEATPALALSYSSLTRASEYGQGWSLNLGRIERSTRHGPPAYHNADDRFELDGELLVRDPGSGARQRRYHRERTQFERIEFSCSPTAACADGGSWTVTRPDGTRLRYGSSANSRLRNPHEGTADGDPATTDVFRWQLDEVIDPRGNAYRIVYVARCDDLDGDCACTQADQGACGAEVPVVSHLYPARIDYSLHPDASPAQATRRIEFEWEPRGYAGEAIDRPTSFRGGFQDSIGWRLAALTAKVGGAQVARWELTYTPKPAPASAQCPDCARRPPFSQLAKIQRRGANGEPFPAPTAFEYTRADLCGVDLPENALPPRADQLHDVDLRDRTPYVFAGIYSGHTTLVDVNGDGLLDRLSTEANRAGGSSNAWAVMYGRFPDPANPARFDAKRDWNWYEQPAQGRHVRPPGVETALSLTNVALELCESGACDRRYAAVDVVDLDGDGRADHVQMKWDAGGRVVGWTFRKGMGDGFAAPQDWPLPEHPILAGEPDAWVYRTLAYNVTASGASLPVASLSRLMDVDGDGLPDHVVTSAGEAARGIWSVALNRGCTPGGCAFAPAVLVDSNYMSAGAPTPFLPKLSEGISGFAVGMDQMDVHGDGLPDLLEGGAGGFSSAPSLLQIGKFNRGHVVPSALAIYSGHVYPSYGILEGGGVLRDVNGDGWLDSIDYRSPDSGGCGRQRVHLGLGDGRLSPVALAGRFWGIGPSWGGVDLDSDGLLEDVTTMTQADHQWQLRDHGDAGRPAGLLTQVTNELGGVTRIDYVHTAAFAGSSAVAASPECAAASCLAQDLSEPALVASPRHFWAVSSITVLDGRSGTAPQTRRMRYAEPRYDREERENRGLRMSEVTDAAGTTTRSLFHQDRFRRGLQQLVEVVTPAGCESGCTVHQGSLGTWTVATPLSEDSGQPILGSGFAAATRVQTWLGDASGARQTKLVDRGFSATYGTLLWEQDHGADGSESGGDDGLRTEIDYRPNSASGAWLVHYPSEVRQRSRSGELLGRIRLFYDGACDLASAPSQGLVTRQLRLADASSGLELAEAFAYDAFGNDVAYWDANSTPANACAPGGPASTTVVYDPDFNAFPTSTSNALGHVTRYRIGARNGQLLRRVDPNGYLECWDEDGFGRLIARRRHGQPQSSTAVDCDETLAQLEYEPSGGAAAQHVREVVWAVGQPGASPACTASRPDCIESFRYFDGLAREYFRSSEAEKTLPPGESGRFFRTRREWGARGERSCEWFPERGGPSPDAAEENCAASSAVDRRVYEYDPLLRVSAQRYGGALERSARYAIADHDGVPGAELVEQLRVLVGDTDRSLDLYRETGRDRDGAVVSLCESPAGGGCPADGSTRTVITLDEKKRVVRVDGPDSTREWAASSTADPNSVSLVYDAADRRLRLVRPPSAAAPFSGPTWSWTYDGNGNVLSARTPRGASSEVRYVYDRLNRLRFKDLPPAVSPAYSTGSAQRQTGDVELAYDQPGDLAGGYGRNLGLLTYAASDALERTHDAALGGLRERTRSVFAIGAASYAYTLASQVDLLGRLRQRSFPDGERLELAYEAATNTSISLLRAGAASPLPLVDGMRRHPSGGLAHFVHSGPGIPVVRTYDPARAQRLASIRVGAAGEIQDLRFDYDRAGNLTAIAAGAAGDEQHFWYDGDHRLIRSVDLRPAAEGGYGALEYAYDDAGNMRRKGLHALRYGGNGALPDAVTGVYLNAYAGFGGAPTIDDPCPSWAGEDPADDPNRDGIPTACQCGDANRDGRVDASDLVAVNRCIFRDPGCGEENRSLCDANGDGACNVSDIIAINLRIFSSRFFELRCARRPEGTPVWDARYAYTYAEDGTASTRSAGAALTAFAWDAEGRLRSRSGAGAASFGYAATGERVVEQVGGTTRLLVSPEYEVDLTAGRHEKHVFVGGQRALTLRQGGIGDAPAHSDGAAAEQQLHLFGDQLGSLRSSVDASGSVVQRVVTTPYGELSGLFDAAGTPLPDTQAKSAFLFTGQRYDAALDLHAMGARDYDPLAGAFLSPDPAWLDGSALRGLSRSAVHLNAYAYANRRPTGVVDPDGREGFEWSVFGARGGRSWSWGDSSSGRFRYDPLSQAGCNWVGACGPGGYDPRSLIIHYDPEVHEGETYTDARRAGFDPGEARYAALYNNGMDDCRGSWGNCPFNYPTGTAKHFISAEVARRNMADALARHDFVGFWQALHAFDDTGAHRGFSLYTLGHVPASIGIAILNHTIGRLGGFRIPDPDDWDPDNDPADRAIQLERRIWIEMAADEFCTPGTCSDHQPSR